MNARIKYPLGILLIFALAFVTACSSIAPATGAPVADTVETNVIAATATSVLPPTQAEAITPLVEVNQPTVTTVDAADLQATLIGLYEQAGPAVVYIVVPNVGSGSGFVYSAEGYIVTNNHVVEGARNIEVVFASGERVSATLAGRDPDSDLAVVKVDQLPGGATPLPLADSDALKVGQFVAAIGSPFGEQGSMSLGIISGLGRSLQSQRATNAGSSYSLPEVIQTDAPINPGNSGGPLLNLNGEVVGINSQIASATGTNSGVGFSIPANAIRRIVPSLIENGAYTYPYLGATFDGEVSLDEQSAYGLAQTQGAYLLDVARGGPAASAGLIAADPNTLRGGDLVIAIDGQAIDDFSDLNSYLVFHTQVGQTIQITVLRNGDRVVVPLVLGARP
jgi:2-alkenal reductase